MSNTPHIVLVGLPGSGKTTAGERAAKKLGVPFLDFDREIERREGQTVQEIFRSKGEPHFRNLELELTKKLLTQKQTLVSPGGGWVTTPQAVALLRPRAHLVYLKVSPKAALLRISGGVGGGSNKTGSRPLLSSDPIGVLNRLYNERRLLYEASDSVIDAEVLTLQQLTEKIAELALGVWGRLG